MPTASATRSSFHHGDLRQAALLAARDRVAERGAEGLVLRELAASLGVNHRALYRHFPDRQALIGEIAVTELGTLVDVMEALLPPEPGALQWRALMEVYVGYALDHPRLYEMVFSLPLCYDADETTEVGLAVRRLVRLAMRVFFQPGDGAGATRDRAIRVWGTAHGLVLLALRGAMRAAPGQALDRYIVDAALHHA
jgi:AcrR family transcriptional regulator